MIQFQQLPFKKENTWISSDFHAFHQNICKGSSNWTDLSKCRDFNDEIEMTFHISTQINSYVKEDDLLIHLGDWSFGGVKNIINFRHMLRCKNILLIQGNHDHHIEEFEHLSKDFYLDGDLMSKQVFMGIHQLAYLQIEHFKFLACHYPLQIWHQSHKGIPNLFGHCHGNYIPKNRSLDVGIDNAYKLFGEYRPFSVKEVESITNSLPILFESHHTKNTN